LIDSIGGGDDVLLMLIIVVDVDSVMMLLIDGDARACVLRAHVRGALHRAH